MGRTDRPDPQNRPSEASAPPEAASPVPARRPEGPVERVVLPTRARAPRPPRPPRKTLGTALRRSPFLLWRYKWAVLAVLAVGSTAAALVHRSQAARYTAEGSIWVETDEGLGASQARPGSGPVLPPAAWADLLTSWTVLDSVVSAQRLHVGFPADKSDVFSHLSVSEEARPGDYVLAMARSNRLRLFDDRGNLLEEAHPDSAVGESFGFEWQSGELRPLPIGEVAPFSISTRRSAAASLADQLDVEVGEDGNMIRVRLASADGPRAASIVNDVMDRTVSLATALKLEQIDDRAEVLEAELARAEAELRTAERNYQRFEVAASPGSGTGAGQDPAAERLIQLRVDADQWRIDRERMESLLAEVPVSGLRIEAMEVIPSVRSASELAGALRELARVRAEIRRLELVGEEARLRLQRSLAESLEYQAIPRLGNALVQQLRDQEAMAQEQTADATAVLSSIPPQRIEQARLFRRISVAETLYQDLYRSFEDVSLTQAVARPDIRVLDRAVAPLSPDETVVTPVVLILLATLGVALLGPFLLARFDPFLRTGTDIIEGLGTQILGVLPRMRSGGRSSGQERAVEALRELRRNLGLALKGDDPLAFAVSSPGQGEGKSVTATNLALAFAETGRGVLLLDADTRNGRLHEALGAESEPGLTDLLMDDVVLGDAIQETPVDGVHLVATGTPAPNGPELLGHPDFEAHLSALREQYDVVIVDCPALHIGGDAVLMGMSAGGLVMVVRHGRTRKDHAAQMVEWLSRFPVRLAGTVFNDVPWRDAKTIRAAVLPVDGLLAHSVGNGR